jgi:hypothetical protein
MVTRKLKLAAMVDAIKIDLHKFCNHENRPFNSIGSVDMVPLL